MKIISLNVNGIRAATRKGLQPWLRAEAPDVIAFQEIKADVDIARSVLLPEFADYHHTIFAAEKPGYSGLAILSKHSIANEIYGCGDVQFDSEGRVLVAETGGFRIVNCYLPSGTMGDARQSVKERFMAHFRSWLSDHRGGETVVMGDFNICHQPIDIHNPKGLAKTTGFLPHERAWMGDLLGDGWTDSFRQLYPEQQTFSWWSQRSGARARNLGWRLDYQLVSAALVPRLLSHRIHTELAFSDHAPTELLLG